MRVRFSGQKVDFNVGHCVMIEKWIPEAQRCKSGTTHGKNKTTATDINNEIQRLENLANDVFKSFELNNHQPTAKEFREAFNEANGKETENEPEQKKTFFFVFDEFVRTMGLQNQWTKATYTKFGSIKNHLLNYNPNLNLETISERDLVGYLQYLHTVVQYREVEDKRGEKKKIFNLLD